MRPGRIRRHEVRTSPPPPAMVFAALFSFNRDLTRTFLKFIPDEQAKKTPR
jgi:hypothetical protein